MCNAALKKPAYQISAGIVRRNMPPALVLSAFLANDGDRTNAAIAGSCVDYDGQENPWWVVDLGVPMTVRFVLLTNHGRCCCTFNSSLLSVKIAV